MAVGANVDAICRTTCGLLPLYLPNLIELRERRRIWWTLTRDMVKLFRSGVWPAGSLGILKSFCFGETGER